VETFMKAQRVVAIAGSLGAMAVMVEILSRLPRDLPAAVVVLIHLSPLHRSRLVEVLARRTSLTTRWADEGLALEAGHVYVSPAARHTEVDSKGVFHLSDAPKRHFTRPSAEPLFASVAEAYGPEAMLVIVSGGGRNGSESLPDARRKGARILVQDPNTATAAGMPIAAIATGAYDAILSIEEIDEELIRFACTDGIPIG
jgi:two-component system chemotaxis response regulator CheB